MIYLNLLPSSEKKLFRLACVEKMANYYFVIAVIAIALLVSVLAGAKYFLLLRANIFEQSMTGQKTEEIAREIQDMESIIKDFNAITNSVAKINAQKMEFSDILINLSEIIPDGIVISDLFYNSSSGDVNKFVLEGKSATREEFLIFIEKLEQSPRFKEINSPMSNIVKKEDINFHIEFNLEM